MGHCRWQRRTAQSTRLSSAANTAELLLSCCAMRIQRAHMSWAGNMLCAVSCCCSTGVILSTNLQTMGCKSLALSNLCN